MMSNKTLKQNNVQITHPKIGEVIRYHVALAQNLLVSVKNKF
ncbi:hypothetical protein ACN4FU_00430 [Aliarcobacter butzleri]